MTNRRDMIDEALLRPGRLEVQLEISNYLKAYSFTAMNSLLIIILRFTGRRRSFTHSENTREYEKLAPDVDLKELAALTKNFSGAELEGLVRATQSSAMNRPIKASNKVTLDTNAVDYLKVTHDDFMNALASDFEPAFGVSAKLDLLTHCSDTVKK